MTDELQPDSPNQPADPQFRQALNESARLLSANRPGEAARILEPLHKQRPQDPDVAINLGGALILQRKWNRAVTVLQSAVKHNPNNVMLWSNLGAAYLGRLETSGPKQQEQAISAYERAVQLDPKAPNVHYHLGLIHKERGNLERAYAHFQRASEVNPADRDARFWIDRLSEMQRNQDQQNGGGDAA
jgi:Flp pilus assembly protein TadD